MASHTQHAVAQNKKIGSSNSRSSKDGVAGNGDRQQAGMDRQQATGNRYKVTGKRQQAIAVAISIAAWGTSSNKRHTNASKGSGE